MDDPYLNHYADRFILLGLGAHGMDVGAMTVFLYTFTERETLYNFFEYLTGARFTVSYGRVGGVARDASDDWLREVKSFAQGLLAKVDEWERLLTRNRIWMMRNEGVGVIPKEMAVSYGLTGPCLRASGVPLDLRKDSPYFGYESHDFDVPVGTRGIVKLPWPSVWTWTPGKGLPAASARSASPCDTATSWEGGWAVVALALDAPW